MVLERLIWVLLAAAVNVTRLVGLKVGDLEQSERIEDRNMLVFFLTR